MNERTEWKDVKGYEGLYKISEYGDVRELEEQNTPGVELNLLNAEVSDLEQQNKRYREALEFYANQSNWMNIEVPTMMDGEPEMVTREPLIFDDGGRKAREALEED